ncbi:MAG TPA: hypothetical protein VGQ03_07100 [Nitrososphaera sp.]|nr:hypothetical protein [Nitrososphaera sp.]
MPAPGTLLMELERLLRESFKDVIVWDQRDADLIGRYVYVKYEGKQVGIFMGYQIGNSGSVRGAITFFFTHPSSDREESKDLGRLFHKLLIRLNLRLHSNPYKRASGKSPAIIRMKYFAEQDVSPEAYRQFFRESVDAIKSCEPLYKTASS